tara:strand:- start:430 stop:807 length:378 start_codon:yes stop_codon:yes gene_type:complete
MDQIKKFLNPKWMLAITALAHGTVGTLVDVDWGDDTSVGLMGFIFLTSITMLYVAFFTEGEQQGRLTAVIAGPAWVWFIICVSLDLTMINAGEEYVFRKSETVMPILLWGLTALSGILHGNFQNK